MIHGWTVFFNGIWVAGLAAALATFSMGAFRVRLLDGSALAGRGVLTQRGYRATLLGAAALVLLGATLSAWLA